MAIDRDLVQQRLEGLNQNAVVAFAYRCALRVIPILGTSGNFEYWKDKQEDHLFAVFHALDVTEVCLYEIKYAANSYDTYAKVANTANEAADTAYDANAKANANAAAANANAAYAAASAYAVAYAAYSAAYSYTAYHSLKKYFSKAIEQMITYDLDYLTMANDGKKNARNLLAKPLWNITPESWPNLVRQFQKALKDIDCDFWYSIFEKRFNSEPADLAALKQRVELPPEIKKQGHLTIIHYLESLQKEGEKRLKEVKVVFLGDGGAGKTSLVKKILDPTADLAEDEKPTPGVDIHTWELKKEEIQAHLWDFGGQVIMHATHQFFMSRRSVYVIVLDGRKEQNPDYWLHHARTFGGESPVLVVMNKVDQHYHELERNTLMNKYPQIKGFFPLSCKDNRGLKTFTDQLGKALKKTEAWDSSLPVNWYKAKDRLQEKNEDYITLETYQKVCQEQTIQEETRDVLLGHLNDLGIVVYFENLVHLNTYVLNPRWLTNAVYQVINSDELQKKKGIIAFDDLKGIFNKKERPYAVPKDKYGFIMETMQEFELAYILNREQRFHQKMSYLIPDLLESDEPADLDFDKTGALIRFRFVFPFLPTSIMARFIVRMADDIDGIRRWRSGVVLRNKTFKSRALITANNDQRLIHTWVKGEQQRDYFAVIRNHFHQIFSSYANFKYHELVPLTEDGAITVNYEQLIGLELMGKPTYSCGELRQEFDLKALLNGIEAEESRKEKAEKQKRKRAYQAVSQRPDDVVLSATEQIFISYSRNDKKWLDELLGHLDALEYSDIRYWYDKDVRAGDNWNEEIQRAVNGCQIAICLISKAFLKSQFIREREIPVLLGRGITIFPILLEPCAWEIVPWLKEIQFINGSTPLSTKAPEEQASIFIEITKEIGQRL